MKHNMTILLICFSFVMHGQDLSEILKGEWLVSPHNTNAVYTQTWNFTSDSTLVLTRSDGTAEYYDYTILHYLVSIGNEEEDIMLMIFPYSEYNLIGVDYMLNTDTELMFTKKNAIDLISSSIQLDEFLFLNKAYHISSSKGSKSWHNKLIRNYNDSSLLFVDTTCILKREYLVMNASKFNMIIFYGIGSIQVIEKQDSSWIKGISLNDKEDTITFQLIENRGEHFVKDLSSFTLKEIKKEYLNDFLDGRSILFVGMGTFQFFKNGKGKFKSSSNEFELDWHYLFDNIIAYEYGRKEIRTNNIGFSRTVTIQTTVYLRFEQLNNGKILATIPKCDGEKTYFIKQ